jgi:branched-chain amino acid transport system substrate-binding protein
MLNKSMIALLCGIGIAAAAFAAGPKPMVISDNVVKLGVLTDMNGIFSDDSGKGSVLAAQMAIDDFNAAAKPAFKIELVWADHQNKADVGSNRAREWYDTQRVDAIFDAINSSVALAVSNVTREKQKVLIVTGAGTTRLTNEECSPYTVNYAWDTYALSRPQVSLLTKSGIDTWFFVTVDYALGHSLEAEATASIKAAGGKVVGSVRHPFNTPDFSSIILQAKASGAKGIVLATAGQDAVNAIKAIREFGIMPKQVIAPMMTGTLQIHSMGLEATQGLFLTDAYYWNLNAKTRAWSRRFFEKHKRMPNQVHAGTYSAVTSYLTAVKVAGTDSSLEVMAELKRMRIDDAFTSNGQIRADGRMVHDMYLAQIKKPSESTEPWDYYTIKQVIPGKDAFQPLSESRCSLVKKS